MRERYDIVVYRRAYFLEPFQAFIAFCRSERFAAKAGEMGGYDISGFGRVHYLGP
jgi:putative molybdopterin biosynthesis protein